MAMRSIPDRKWHGRLEPFGVERGQQRAAATRHPDGSPGVAANARHGARAAAPQRWSVSALCPWVSEYDTKPP
ncbi:hypothetical protein XTALMG727_3423 [Xanthomonas translucens pv. arrhenatheri LMG 727]|uniref:Uncharacterized protein n=1 Tax=Xanthomonas graminis pv. arrhenatheri LMG 727 TaxID=1195923 RepID=A0A0K3A7F9_9XANT|nr:hypothetical protein XTALMG727_3423 [Xanthomonas translucens pv. arrhenatheri LMG 727]